MIRKTLVTLLLVVPMAPVLADKHASTLKRVADSGMFRIGYRTDARPLSFVDENGSPAGYSVDLCRRIGAAGTALITLVMAGYGLWIGGRALLG